MPRDGKRGETVLGLAPEDLDMAGMGSLAIDDAAEPTFVVGVPAVGLRSCTVLRHCRGTAV